MQSPHSHQPLLIADDPALDAYMADVHGKNLVLLPTEGRGARPTGQTC